MFDEMNGLEILFGVCLDNILLYGKGAYETIAKNMLNEDFYFMQGKVYDCFIKIMEQDELVGFIVGNCYNNELIVLELGYILPLYRDKGLFIKTLYELEELVELSLHLPNRFVIKSLLDNGKARLINKGLVKSDYLLSFRNPLNDEILFSYYYDLRVSGVVCDNMVSPLMSVDIDCFNADIERSKYMSKIISDGEEIWFWS